MSQTRKVLVKIIGSALILFGFFKIIFGVVDVWWSIRFLFGPHTHNTLAEVLFFSGTILFLNLILPVLAIMAGFGLIKLKRWGWIWSITVLLIMFAINFGGTINFAVSSYYLRNVPMPKTPKGAVVQAVSMWPIYIYALISILFVLVLTRESVKKEFGR